jgi:anti-anti-sigma factor
MGNIKTEIHDPSGAIIVRLQGEIDLHSAAPVHDHLEKITSENPPRLVVDLAKVTYIDSSGVATLVSAFQRMNQQEGQLAICDLSPRVRSVFEIAQLHHIIPIYDTCKEACEA